MSISKKHREIIDKAVDKGKWHFFAKRADAPPLPLIHKFFTLNTDRLKKIYGASHLPSLGIWQDTSMTFYSGSAEYKENIEAGIGLLSSLSKVKKHIATLEGYSDNIKKFATKLYDNVDSSSVKELSQMYNKVIEYYGISMVQGFFTWLVAPLQGDALDILSKYKEQLERLGLDEKSAFAVLAVADKESPYFAKEKVLDELSIKYKDKNLEDQDIDDFLDKYQWVGYDYGGPAISRDEVMQDITEREIKDDKTISKSELEKSLGLDKKEAEVFKVFALNSYAKDLRNSCDDYVHFCIDHFYKKVGEEYGLSLEEVKFLWPEELSRLVEGKERYSKQYLKDKMSYSVIHLDGDDIKYYIGQEAKDFVANEISSQEDLSEVKEIKGMVASPGKVTAKVKIIESFSEVDKIAKGEVLVASMTSPRLMGAIVKAGAIITDEGGMTCHAAIISRELKIPCIVGTKIATKILKDGDTVALDADKGIIKKID